MPHLKLIIPFCLIILYTASCIQPSIDKQTVRSLDIKRFMGKWFEIARFDHHFEHNLVGSTIEYELQPTGEIKVTNTGYWEDFDGTCCQACGVAKIPNPDQPGSMRITYFLKFYAEYNIMEVDEENYSYALIGSNTCHYLWLLSRTPTLSEKHIKYLLHKAKQRGYDISMLKWVKHQLPLHQPD